MNKFSTVWVSFILILSFYCFGHGLSAQVVLPDSITVSKSWTDKNGSNRLQIKVNALCNPDRPPFDGHETRIEASLYNSKYTSVKAYNDEDYQMEMIFFKEKNIWFREYSGGRAVFIPFSYCGNDDTDKKISLIIFYGRDSYLCHIQYKCDELGGCTINDKSGVKLQHLPVMLRKDLIKRLKTTYRNTADFN
ncbi:hypothetical protein [Pedobacter antarcticus]|uniref:hypothetical protein n=1 Tax=Pedobacter antarcticus TaxID=34086 RepID=UPI001C57808B|nr:hypothetical protein [Pedobacter antarcticus]